MGAPGQELPNLPPRAAREPTRRNALATLRSALLIAAFALSTAAAAQTYPSRPITVINPFPAGGGTDILIRTLTEHMKGTLGHPIIVENVTGAGGSIGATRGARAAPDGYTVSLGNWASHVGSGAMYQLPFDLLRDLEPVALITMAPLWIVARKTFPADDMAGLIGWMKSNPDKATAATVGIGSGSHLCGLYLQNSTGARFQFVPYRGGGPAAQDLIAGNVDFMCDFAGNSLPFARSGQIKPLAVMAKERWFAAPDVPSIDETGLPSLHVSFWHGLWVPKGTAVDIIGKLNGAVVKAFANATVRQRFTELGHAIPPEAQQSPQALGAYHQSEIETWWPIIKAANLKPE